MDLALNLREAIEHFMDEVELEIYFDTVRDVVYEQEPHIFPAVNALEDLGLFEAADQLFTSAEVKHEEEIRNMVKANAIATVEREIQDIITDLEG